MSLFSTFDVSASGLTANRVWMDTIANNVSNINTTRTPEGGPYKRQQVVLSSKGTGEGVRVAGIVRNEGQPRLVYDPQHPDADESGYVAMPDINIVTEMVNMVAATRAYEANVTVIGAAKSMSMKALEI
ncbi:MAG TPA: flagellar basal body rod protein FlgC [Actinobacteria bacterium]|nr:flagellar basal body rod protein FlgC [Actinomycetota bacterium]